MRIAIVVLSVLVLSSLAISQISVTSSDMQAMYAPGKSWRMFDAHSLKSATMNVGVPSSTAQSWSLPSVTYTDTMRADNVLPSSTLYASRFRPATHAQRMVYVDGNLTSTSYSYVRVTTDSLISIGSAYRSQEPGRDTTFFEFTTHLQFLLPLQMGRTMTRVDTIWIVPAISYIVQRYTVAVDGFGSLTVPAGTFQALRMKETSISQSVYPGFPMPPDTSVSLSWFTKEGYSVSIEPSDKMQSSGTIPIKSISYSFITTTPTGIADQDPILPMETRLHQNYPNPFNPATAISFQLSATSFASLKVFNSLGEEVATLVSEVRPAGTYTVRWNGSGQPSGVYLYRLIAGGQVQVGKMSLVK